MINIKSISIILLCAFSFFLPISQKASTFLLFPLALSALFQIKEAKFTLPSLLLVSLYFLYLISVFSTKQVDLNVLERKASLIVFPFIFSVISIDRQNLNRIFKYFVIGCFLSVLICEAQAVYHTIESSSVVIKSPKDASITTYESIIIDKNRLFSFNFSILHQAVYFSIYLTFALVLLVYDKVFQNNKIRLVLIGVFLLAIFQVLNKASFVVLFLIVLVAIIRSQRKTPYSKKQSLLLILTLILLISNPRLKNVYNSTFFLDESKMEVKDFNEIKNINPNDFNFRVMLWSSSLDIIKKNPFFGVGASVSSERLNEVFAVKRQWYDKSERYHAHNQFLQIILDIGIVGFIVFLALLFSFWPSKLKKSPMKLIIINFGIILIINFMFESMFERYSGLSFFCFFFCVFTNFSKNATSILKQESVPSKLFKI